MAGTLEVQTIQGPTSGANANKIIVPSGHTLAAAGHVVQVEQAILQGVGSISGNVWTTILSKSITPTATNSKIIVTCDGTFGNPTTGVLESAVRTLSSVNGAVQVSTAGTGNQINGNASIYTPNGTHQLTSTSWTVIDEPNTTSTVTYSLQAYASEGQSMYYGRDNSAVDANYVIRSSLRILLMEIAQ